MFEMAKEQRLGPVEESGAILFTNTQCCQKADGSHERGFGARQLSVNMLSFCNNLLNFPVEEDLDERVNIL